MEHLQLGLGTIWLLFTIVATAFLGSDFILHEILTVIRRRRDSDAE
jgi:UPF0716 family protein affecting phage T7 exclusion